MPCYTCQQCIAEDYIIERNKSVFEKLKSGSSGFCIPRRNLIHCLASRRSAECDPAHVAWIVVHNWHWSLIRSPQMSALTNCESSQLKKYLLSLFWVSNWVCYPSSICLIQKETDKKCRHRRLMTKEWEGAVALSYSVPRMAGKAKLRLQPSACVLSCSWSKKEGSRVWLEWGHPDCWVSGWPVDFSPQLSSWVQQARAWAAKVGQSEAGCSCLELHDCYVAESELSGAAEIAVWPLCHPSSAVAAAYCRGAYCEVRCPAASLNLCVGKKWGCSSDRWQGKRKQRENSESPWATAVGQAWCTSRIRTTMPSRRSVWEVGTSLLTTSSVCWGCRGGARMSNGFDLIRSVRISEGETKNYMALQWWETRKWISMKDSENWRWVWNRAIKQLVIRRSINQGEIGNCWFLSALTGLCILPSLYFYTLWSSHLAVLTYTRCKICKNAVVIFSSSI